MAAAWYFDVFVAHAKLIHQNRFDGVEFQCPHQQDPPEKTFLWERLRSCSLKWER